MSINNKISQKNVVIAMYKFVTLVDCNTLRTSLLDLCISQRLKGTILLAEEGINGTIAGGRTGIDNLKSYLRSDVRFSDIKYKESYVDEIPFYRMKVKLKKEIVSMGINGLNPANTTGIKVDPDQWNELISDPEILLIDTRNQYEYKIGTFRNAISPNTNTFREFPSYVEKELNNVKQKKIAMFCTGGIRCEKASAYLINQGFQQVYQLNGGILKYLENISSEKNLWQGECFVFDGRVSVDEQLNEGRYEQCFACRMPLSEQDRKSEYFEQGISCPHCYENKSDEKRNSLKERQKQVDLAKSRNKQHIGIPLSQK